MIAMQYSFPLPADYDMTIIDRRIAEKGHLLDNFPNLKLKAYLTARSGDGTQSRENLYAPFYLWNHEDGLNDFLTGEGFAALTRSFGWPVVRTWFIWKAHLSPDVAQATFVTREMRVTAAHSALGELRQRESEEVFDDVQNGRALASISAFEPASWTRVRLQLWGEPRPLMPGPGVQAYRVGHISLPKQD
ncbi:DUF4865 family protein [Phyllobacterium lublinensis]|uniref:DUF4865 family protein n=1 Tax=Phyllobacterium lublinensis TaxID=2875708 RepID=UPI001CCE6E03|nr:DUF4865 family protein [Phyllobacterium sp. 2063]MBZ9657027.1 DUF4865 family protein [Phyllobacterium sp. 2063]